MTDTTLDPRYSDPEAQPTAWADAQRELEEAKAYWLSTVRADGRPHVTTVAALWFDGAMYFATGVDEQKEKNLEHNPHCVITTGCNAFEGLDVAVEADAILEADPARLQALADAYRAKYHDLFDYELRDGGFRLRGDLGDVLVYRLKATKAFGFGKAPFSQTRWRFDS
jgi:general stress protein 26